MNKKILIPIVLVVLVAVGGFAAYTLTKSKKTVKVKVSGTIYILPKEFTINLNDGQYAALTVALLLPASESVGTTSATNPPPTGFGTLPEEAVIRAIITNDITDQSESTLLTITGRHRLEAKILSDINKQTDEKVTALYFTDLAVQ